MARWVPSACGIAPMPTNEVCERRLHDAHSDRIVCEHDLEFHNVTGLDQEDQAFNAFDRAPHSYRRCVLRPRN
jgi:hypothetical protein